MPRPVLDATTDFDPFRLDLSPEDEEFRQTLRGWLRATVPAAGPSYGEDEQFEFTRAWQQAMFAAGWAGVSWPVEFGGRGDGPMKQFLYYVEIARSRAPDLANQAGIILFGPTLMTHGSEKLKERYLRPMLSAEEIWSQGFSEPGAGSDLSAIRTEAELDAGGDLVLNGQKIWTSWAPYADFCAVLCRTEQDAPRHAAFSLLIVDMRQEGVTVRPITQITGARREFGEVFFDDVHVPADHVVGNRGDGWQCAMTMLEFERSDLGLHDHGRLYTTLAEIGDLLRVARTHWSSHDLGDLRHRYAEAWLRCTLLRRFNYAVALRRQAGETIGTRASVVRVYYSELAQQVAELGADVAAACPSARDFAYEFLHSRSTTIAAGTAEVQRNIISDRLLGLPR